MTRVNDPAAVRSLVTSFISSLDEAVALPQLSIEFWPWDDIPADRRRDDGEQREVFGVTFLGEPIWLPHMGQS